MGNLGSCIGIRGAERQEDEDYLYLDRRPPALIDGYEPLSYMYYTHARMAIVHLNNDTGHFLKLKVVVTISRLHSTYIQYTVL